MIVLNHYASQVISYRWCLKTLDNRNDHNGCLLCVPRQCCVGIELVDWQMQQSSCVHSRLQAVGMWQVLLEEGVLNHGEILCDGGGAKWEAEGLNVRSAVCVCVCVWWCSGTGVEIPGQVSFLPLPGGRTGGCSFTQRGGEEGEPRGAAGHPAPPLTDRARRPHEDDSEEAVRF